MKKYQKWILGLPLAIFAVAIGASFLFVENQAPAPETTETTEVADEPTERQLTEPEAAFDPVARTVELDQQSTRLAFGRIQPEEFNRLAAESGISLKPRRDFIRNPIPVRVDFGVLEEARERKTHHIQFDLGLARPVEAEVLHRFEHGLRAFTIAGQLEGDSLSEFSVSVYEDAVVGTFISPKLGVRQLRYAGPDMHKIEEIDVAAMPSCVEDKPHDPAEVAALAETLPQNPPDGILPELRAELMLDGIDPQDYLDARDGDSIHAMEPGAPKPDRGDDQPSAMIGPDTDVFDILIVYTQAAIDDEGSVSALLALINQGIADTNLAFESSSIDAHLRLVGTAQVDYTGTAAQAAINAVRGTADGDMDEVHALRDSLGADFVSLWTPLSDACGIASLITTLSTGQAYRAFGVCDPACQVQYTFTHELGHNWGCAHAVGDGTTTRGRGIYDYSHGWRWNGTNSVQYRSVMAYSPGIRIRQFSDPGVLYQGVATGQVNSEDNAQTIDLIKGTMSQFRAAPSGDDHGNTTGAATLVEVSGGVTGNLETAGDVDFFRMVFPQPGTLQAFTTGSTDTYGQILDQTGAVLVQGNGGGAGSNFDLTHVSAPGTYYVRVSGGLGSTTGEYFLNLQFTDAPDDHGDDFDEATVVTAGSLETPATVAGEIEAVGDLDFFRVTLPASSPDLDELDPIVIDFEGPPVVTSTLSSDDYEEDGYLIEPYSDNYVYRQLSGQSNWPDNGTTWARFAFSQDMQMTAIAGTTFGVTSIDISEYSTVFSGQRETVTIMGVKADGSTVSTNFLTDGIIDGSGAGQDFETFVFPATFTNLTKLIIDDSGFVIDNIVVEPGGAIPSGTLVVNSTGSTDMRAELYNASQTLVASDNDNGDGLNFRISEIDIPSGLYYLKVFENGNNQTGLYSLSFGWEEGSSSPEIRVHEDGLELTDGNSTTDFGAIAAGTNLVKTYTIDNIGPVDLSGLSVSVAGAGAAQFSVTQPAQTTLANGEATTFTVQYTAVFGIQNATLQISNNDPNENPFDIALVGEGVDPEISVEQPAGVILVDGANTIDIGSVAPGQTAMKTFTIRSLGPSPLGNLALSIDGAAAGDFSASALGQTTLPVGNSQTFNVTFTADYGGTRTAALHIASNDFDENPFTVNLTATSLDPEIIVAEPAHIPLVDGVSSRSLGSSNVGEDKTKTFTIQNVGAMPLTGLAASITGTHAADFSAASPSAATIQPGESATCVVTFNPSATGSRSAALQITSNDRDENPFDISLSGTGTLPAIAVQYPLGVNLVKSATIDYGLAPILTSNPRTFRIRNNGNGQLNQIQASLVGAAAGHWNLTPPSNEVSTGGFSNFTVRFAPQAGGAHPVTLRIESNDPDDSPFDLNLTGYATIPDIGLEIGGVELANGSTYFFPEIFGPTPSSQIAFVNILSQGDGGLANIESSVIGRDAAQFMVPALGGSSLDPGSTTSFVMTFTPVGEGDRIATMQITSSDPDENPFEVHLAGGRFQRVTLNDFADQHGLTGEARLPNSDQDGDGASLLEEYAFNLNPTIADLHHVTGGGNSGLPRFYLVDEGGGVQRLRCEYIRRRNDPDLTVEVEFATTISEAEPDGFSAAAGAAETSVDTEFRRGMIDDSVTTATHPARFGRVKVLYASP